MSNTYTGPTIKIRRISDSSTVDFFAISNTNSQNNLYTNINGTAGTTLNTWLTSTTGYVTTLYDQTGNGKHATQTNQANQPIILTIPIPF